MQTSKTSRKLFTVFIFLTASMLSQAAELVRLNQGPNANDLSVHTLSVLVDSLEFTEGKVKLGQKIELTIFAYNPYKEDQKLNIQMHLKGATEKNVQGSQLDMLTDQTFEHIVTKEDINTSNGRLVIEYALIEVLDNEDSDFLPNSALGTVSIPIVSREEAKKQMYKNVLEKYNFDPSRELYKNKISNFQDNSRPASARQKKYEDEGREAQKEELNSSELK